MTDCTAEYVGLLRGGQSSGRSLLDEAVALLDSDPGLGAVGRHLDPEAPSMPAVLAVLFDGLVARRSVFLQAGGFDESLGPDAASLDLCWRLAVLGFRVRALDVPSTAAPPPGRPLSPVYRSEARLVAAAKNLDDETLPLVMAAAIAEEVRGSISRGGADAAALDLQRSPGGDDVGTLTVSSASLDGARAVESFIDLLPAIADSRARIAAARRVPDRALFPLVRHELERGLLAAELGPGVSELREILGITGLLTEPLRVAILLGAAPSEARLARFRTLAGLLEGAGLRVRLGDVDATSATRHDLALWCDVLVLDSGGLSRTGWLPALEGRVVVVDLDVDVWDAPGASLADALGRADLVLCSSEAARDSVLGALAGTQRVNAAVYDEDASLDSLALVVPGDSPDDLAAVVAFCRSPRRAADVGGGRDLASGPAGPRPSMLTLMRAYHDAGGVPEVVRRARGRVVKKLRRSR